MGGQEGAEFLPGRSPPAPPPPATPLDGSNGRIFKFWLLFWIYANYCTQGQEDRGTIAPCLPNTLLLAQSEVISNTPNMQKYMLRNTATSINSNNNNNRNNRITVTLALGKLCILHFLTPSDEKCA